MDCSHCLFPVANLSQKNTYEDQIVIKFEGCTTDTILNKYESRNPAKYYLRDGDLRCDFSEVLAEHVMIFYVISSNKIDPPTESLNSPQ